MTQLPIRWRLTIWYSAFSAAAFLLFGVAFYLVARHEIYDTFNEQLHSQAALVSGAVQQRGSHIGIDENALKTFSDDDHYVRLFGPDGTIELDTSATAGGAPLDSGTVNSALGGETVQGWFSSDGGKMGVITAPISIGGERVGVVQVGVSRQDSDDLLRILAIALAVTAPVALIIATVGGYLLARRALNPVAEITMMASQINADDLHARLDLALPDDEVGRLATTFDAMLARIDSAFEQQRRFTADAAHELRTPLSLLRGQVDLALSRPRSAAEYRGALRGIEGDLERMTGLVSTLLSLARAENGKLPLEFAKVEVGAVVGVVLDQYRPGANLSGIDLVNESSEVVVDADEDLLIQVFVNLMDNSLHHSKSGDRITIGCRKEEQSARIWVADTGSGIPQEQLLRIFDPFYRVDSGRSREHGGVGLGLSICKAITEAHGGVISIQSQLQQGTRVEVRIPTTQSPN